MDLVRRRRWLTVVLLVMGTLFLMLSGCGTTSHQRTTTKTTGIHVVASLDFYGEAAQKILGSAGTVTTVINSPSIDPESFEPDIATAKTVAKADVVIQNGLGYDSWMERLVAANAHSQIHTLTLGNLIGRKMGDNPHLWSDPQLMITMTRQLVKQFSKLDPAHAADFKRRGAAYERQLQVLPQLVQRIKKQSHGQTVAVSEPVFSLALDAMGYRVSDNHFAQAIEEDSDPTPADITQLQDQIKHHKIAFFVENTQNSSNNVTTMVRLAHKYHVPVVKVTETMPVHTSYRDWMAGQYRQVLRIQQEARTAE
ncbi:MULTISPECIES: metal ABC transporter solute-binding protein, Zn/Mn family [Levilactobacillus]|uniref:metal ABC transporter solute-binding protein, Zn/Mn family n=1 Tax=Levilactobacillus TaxID=2767886 RepID=UPI000B34AF30|nr:MULTISPECIES: zinc ABC transporter substrate-binding protein [Levilactobacillus]